MNIRTFPAAPTTCLFLLLPIALWPSPSHAQVDKWADPPYLALSQNMTPAVEALPEFGEIEWTLERIPFIDDSPAAGISGAGMVTVDGKIYLMGGFIPAGDGTNDKASRRTSRWAHVYNPQTKQWTRLPDMPGRREYTRAIATNDAIYVMGGSMQRQGNPEGEFVSDDCFKLDLKKMPLRWEKQGNLNVPRTHMGVGRVGDLLIVCGGVKWDRAHGYHSSTIKNTVDLFDLSRPHEGWQSKTPIPGVGRGWIASAPCKDQFYIFSGLTFDDDRRSTWVDQSLRYDPQADRWTQIAKPPVWVSGWEGATYRDRYIIIVGGNVGPTKVPYTNANLWNDIAFVYDTEQDRWSKITSVIPPGGVYNDSGVVIIGDTIYVAGGEGARGSHFNHFVIGRIKPNLSDLAAARPLQVGAQKQVFIDGRFIEKSQGVELTVNRPRITGEKLIVPEHPWEDFYIGAYTSVIQDQDRIHMWYETGDKRELSDPTAVAYAYSTDGGSTWIKPKLGVVGYEGSRENNLVLTRVHGSTVFRNRPDAPRDERYCLFAAQSDATKTHKHPNRAYYSPDGINWTATGEVPFFDESGLKKYHHFHLDSQNVMFWDTRLRKYVFWPRVNVSDTENGGWGRTVGRSVSDMFGHFPTPTIVFRRDEKDPPDMDFYTSGAIQYPFAADAYYLFPAAYHHYPSPPHPGNDGPIDIQFAASRDGIDWVRPDRRPIIRMGFDNQWDDGASYAGYGLSRHGDELSLYYTANDVTHGAYKERGYLGGTITRAIYRLDGFMSVDAVYEGGEFTTPPLIFHGDRLEINFDGSAGGWARVEILDATDRSIPGFTEEDGDKISGNAVDHLVSWNGRSDVSTLKGKPVKLRFILRNAKLYAFQFAAGTKASRRKP